MIVAWAIKGLSQDNPKDEEFVAKKIISHYAEIIIPSVVVAETAVGIDKDLRKKWINFIYERFTVADFDRLAVQNYPNLWEQKYQKSKAQGMAKQKIKTDFLVLCTALSTNCDVLVTNDKELIKMASDFINTLTLQQHSGIIDTQMPLNIPHS